MDSSDNVRRPVAVHRSHSYAVTAPAPCPYLADRVERRLFTRLGTEDGDARHDALILAGYRRSQEFAYRPVCPACNACRPVRIPVADFVWTRSWRKLWRRAQPFTVSLAPPRYTEEHYALFRRYLDARHGDGGMADMDTQSFREMLEASPVGTVLAEFRDGEGRLIAASLTDVVASGLSGVYKYFEPELSRLSLGTVIILWHIQEALAAGRPYVYLGYWIAESPKMAYKGRFRPLEVLEEAGWRRLADAGEASED